MWQNHKLNESLEFNLTQIQPIRACSNTWDTIMMRSINWRPHHWGAGKNCSLPRTPILVGNISKEWVLEERVKRNVEETTTQKILMAVKND